MIKLIGFLFFAIIVPVMIGDILGYIIAFKNTMNYIIMAFPLSYTGVLALNSYFAMAIFLGLYRKITG